MYIIVAGYQIDIRDDFLCFRLHDGMTSPEWSLIETTNSKLDPDIGVQIKYKNGDFCDRFGVK